MSYARKTNMAGDAQGRVVIQYRTLPIFMALIGQLGAMVQMIEDAFWDLYSAAFLDTATGVWLEYLGGIVGENREGYNDTDYRGFIKARILANKSSGTIDEVLTILAMVLGTAINVTYISAVEFYPASMLVMIDLAIHPNAALRNRLCRIVARARPTGVRFLINTFPSDINTFQMGDSGVAQPQMTDLLGFGDTAFPDPGGTGGMFASGDLA